MKLMTDNKTEVEKLKQEIINLKADKDFVWSLWKRLQLSSPDLTEAVNLINQREKEKLGKQNNEIQEAVKERDERVQEMQAIIDSKNIEIEVLVKSNNAILKKATQLEKHCADVTEKASRLDKLMTNMEENEKRQIVTAYENERHQLTDSVSKLQAKITALMDEKIALQVQNVKNEECMKYQDDLQDHIGVLRQQLEEANTHIDTQQETIQILREQVERMVRSSGDKVSEEGYSSDHTVEYQTCRNGELCGAKTNEEERPGSPIEDLNYKVDRLSLHMQQLQHCISSRTLSSSVKLPRSRSTPPRKNHKVSLRHEEMSRKIQFLSQKLERTENLLTEEKKNSGSTTEFLEKANKRIKSMQLTIKQLRSQVEESKQAETEWRSTVNQLEMELETRRKEIRNQTSEIQRMHDNSVTDASRIQELLVTLERTRDDLTEKRIREEQNTGDEIERLKDLVKQIEGEKCLLEQRYKEAVSDKIIQVWSGDGRSQKQPCPSSRGRRVKICSGKTRHVGSKKTKSMHSILNHFSTSDTLPKGDIKDEEWEDVNSDEEGNPNEITPSTDRSCAGQSSDLSTGTRIARVAAINLRCDSERIPRNRSKEAKINHVIRIQDKKENSSVLDNETVLARNRIASLQQQLKTVIMSRDLYKSKLKTLQSQMKNVHTDLSQAKLRCSHLIEAIKKQCTRNLLLQDEQRQRDVTKTDRPLECFWSETGLDIDEMGALLQGHLTDVSANISLCRELQHELTRKDSELAQARDKLVRMDRDNCCKKRIIEDLRNKLMLVDGEKEKEKGLTEMKEKKHKEIEDSNFRMKIQMESLQTRLNVVQEERRRFEQESTALFVKGQAAESKIEELKHAKQVLESRLSKLDQGHASQINDIVNRSGSALDQASMQIKNLKIRCGRYETLIVNLSKDFYHKTREIRRLLEFSHRRINNGDTTRVASSELPKGYEFARNKAADILSLSTSDIDSLLNGVPDSNSNTGRHNRRSGQRNNSAVTSDDESADISTRCQRAFRNKSFDQQIQAIFAEKLEELVDLVAPASCDDSGCVSFS